MSAVLPNKDGLRRYGNQNNVVEDVTRCAYEVWAKGPWPRPYQCSRKRRCGPGDEYCRQHAARLAADLARTAL